MGGCLAGSALAAHDRFTERAFARAIVIDACGGPGGFDADLPDDAPLTPKFVTDAAASDVTAVNLTVNDVGNGPNRFERAVAGIALAEHELTAHPEVFLKVLNASHLAQAKASRRMGLIFGCQNSTMLEGDLKRLSRFHDLGVRICQPTYNQRNVIGDGCLELADGATLYDVTHLGCRSARYTPAKAANACSPADAPTKDACRERLPQAGLHGSDRRGAACHSLSGRTQA